MTSGFQADQPQDVLGSQQDGAQQEPVTVADQLAAGVPSDQTVTVAEQKAGTPAPSTEQQDEQVKSGDQSELDTTQHPPVDSPKPAVGTEPEQEKGTPEQGVNAPAHQGPTVELPADAPYIDGLTPDPLADDRNDAGQLPPPEHVEPE